MPVIPVKVTMRSDFEVELVSSDITRRATHVEAKYKFYFSRFVPEVILTLKFKRVRYVGPARLLKEISERLQELEQLVQNPLAWAIVDDFGKSGKLLRFHLLITGTTDVTS